MATPSIFSPTSTSMNSSAPFSSSAKNKPPFVSDLADLHRAFGRASLSSKDWRWGIDIGSRKFALCAATEGIRTWLVHDPFADARTVNTIAHELATLRAAVHDNLIHLATILPPTVVLIEQPSGSHRNLRFEAAFGAIMEATFTALNAVGPVPIIDHISGSQWKKDMLGHGGVNAAEYHRDARRRFGSHLPDNPDVSAALWIAEYAMTLEVETG